MNEQTLSVQWAGPRFSTRRLRSRLPLGTSYAVLIGISLVMLFPFAWMVSSSLKVPSELFAFPPAFVPAAPRWANYIEAMTVLPFPTYFLNTLKIEVGFVVGSIVTNIFPAYSFARLRWPGRDLVFYVLLSILLLPQFITLVPTFVIWSRLGFLDTFVPLILPAWLGNPFFIFLLRQFFTTLPPELESAAYIDGASHTRAFLQIILPTVKPALAVVALFSFQGVWNDLLQQLIYLNSPENYTLSLGLRMFLGMYSARWDLMMAATAVTVAPMALLFFLCQRYFIEGVTMTGLKG